MKRNISDSLGGVISISPSDDKKNSLVCGRGFQSMLDGIDDEDCLDETGQISEKKRRLSVDQVKALEKSFEVENKLEPEREVKLAQDLGLQPRQVAVWFHNRRARWKTKQLERDYGTMIGRQITKSQISNPIQTTNASESDKQKSVICEDNKRQIPNYSTILTQTKSYPSKVPNYIPYKSISQFTMLGKLSDKPQIKTPSQKSNSSINMEYSYQPSKEFICILETPVIKKFPDLNPITISQAVLPITHMYLPDNFAKSISYYQEILVQSKSVQITYTYDSNNIPCYCKVKIFQVLTLEDWGLLPGQLKDLQILPKPSSSVPTLSYQRYNYWDYITAWRRAFYLQNSTQTLSYFFYFAETFTYHTPNWFFKWWYYFGLNETVVPPEIQTSFKKFQSQCKLPNPYIYSPFWMLFSHNFQVPWIFMTEFKITEDKYDHVTAPTLYRSFKIKWWGKTDIQQCSISAINKFFIDYPQFDKDKAATGTPGSSAKPNEDKSFQNKKKNLLEQLQKCKNDQEMHNLLAQLTNISEGSTVSPCPSFD